MAETRESKTVYFGDVHFKNEIILSDPMYSHTQNELNVKLEGIKPGKYSYYGTQVDCGKFLGRRLYNVYAVYHNKPEYMNDDSIPWQKVDDATVCVDGGVAGMFNYDYYKNHHQGEGDTESWVCNIANQLFKTKYLGSFNCDDGFATSSGFGDGSYAVYYKKDHEGYIVAIKIDYEYSFG